MLAESGVGSTEDILRAKSEFGLGLFIRSLVGLDRAAAKDALGSFTDGKPMSANQIEFVDLVVNHLTEHGVMEPARLYESPFTDIAPQGPDALFSSSQIDQLFAALSAIRAGAQAA